MDREICSHSGIASDGKYIWYITEMDCFLMQADIITGIVICLGKIPETEDKPFAYRTLFYRNKTLILIPYMTQKLCIYQLEDSEFDLIDFPDQVFREDEKERKLFGHILYGDELILFGTNPVIVRFHISGHTFKSYRMDQIARLCDNPDVWFWRDRFLIEDCLMLPLVYGFRIVRVNLKYDEVYVNRVVTETIDMDTIEQILVCQVEGKIYHVCSDRKWALFVYVTDLKSWQTSCQYYDLHTKLADYDPDGTVPFTCGDIVNHKMILFPARHGNVVVIDLCNGYLEVLSECPTVTSEYFVRQHQSAKNYFSGIYVDKDHLILIHTILKKIVRVNVKKWSTTVTALQTDEQTDMYFRRYYGQLIKQGKAVREQEEMCSLKELLNQIEEKNKEQDHAENAGEKIWKKLCLNDR